MRGATRGAGGGEAFVSVNWSIGRGTIDADRVHSSRGPGRVARVMKWCRVVACGHPQPYPAVPHLGQRDVAPQPLGGQGPGVAQGGCDLHCRWWWWWWWAQYIHRGDTREAASFEHVAAGGQGQGHAAVPAGGALAVAVLVPHLPVCRTASQRHDGDHRARRGGGAPVEGAHGGVQRHGRPRVRGRERDEQAGHRGACGGRKHARRRRASGRGQQQRQGALGAGTHARTHVHVYSSTVMHPNPHQTTHPANKQPSCCKVAQCRARPTTLLASAPYAS